MTFPTVSEADRLERSTALDPSAILLSPGEAALRAGVDAESAAVRLHMLADRPVYRFTAGRSSERVVFADTGETLVDVSRALMDRVATR